MNKSLLILLLGSMIIVTSCSAKDDTNGMKSADNNIENMEKESVENQSVNDRSNDIKAPDFKLATIAGEEFSLSDFKGKVVLLNFWGTWCPPCRKEIPDLINLQKKYNKDGLEIIGITLNSGSAMDIQKFAKEKMMNYTILTDFNYNETVTVTNLYGQTIGEPISSIPTTLIIDREGYIVKGYLGPRTEEVFYNDIKEYL